MACKQGITTQVEMFDLELKRVQFTHDLMPPDITGTEVIYQGPTINERQ